MSNYFTYYAADDPISFGLARKQDIKGFNLLQ